ncbi:10379_t:CDS:2, partial [Racocetra fulgida]
QLVLIETQDSSCIKLSDGCIYHVNNIEDLAIRRGKASGSKTQQASFEDVEAENNKTGISRCKCGLYHKIGYYAPRCPNKKNTQI